MIEMVFAHSEVTDLARELELHRAAACWEVQILLVKIDQRISAILQKQGAAIDLLNEGESVLLPADSADAKM